MNSRNVGTVLKWEFMKHIKSPVFLIFTFLIPAIMAVASFLPAFVMDRMSEEERNLWILDETSQLAPVIQGSLADSKFNITIVQGNLEELKDQVGAGEAHGILHITQTTLDTGQLQLYTKDLTDFSRNEVQQMIQPAYTQYRLHISGISPEDFASILVPPSLQMFNISGEEDSIAAFLIPLFTGMFLFISVLFSGQILMQSVIKEKRNRIIEVLLSSLSAFELLVGKILAFGGLALLQITIWVTVGLFAASRYIDLAAVGLDFNQLLTTIPYFILGYLLLATLFAAAAATMKDAESGSQAHGLVIMIPILPLMLSTPIMMSPNSAFAQVMSFIPIFTPATMLLRLGATTVPHWEIVTTLVILFVSTILFLKIGAKIYEGSLLKFDTAASFKDIITMLRKDQSQA